MKRQELVDEAYERFAKDKRGDMTEEEMWLAAHHEAQLSARRIDKERK